MGIQTPFDLLWHIHKQCEENYFKFSMEDALQWQGLLFTVGQTQFVTPIWQISEIIPVPVMATIPGMKSFVKGLAQLRGELIIINDLSHLLETEAAEGGGVLISEISGEKIGFMVTKVDKLVIIRQQQLQEFEHGHAYMSRYMNVNDHKTPVLDFKALVDEPSFIQVRAPKVDVI